MSKKMVDGSLLLVEGAARAGVEYYSGYPITPANRIYFNAVDRVPSVLKAPDEITALQWASGLAATGNLAMTGTSRPGLSLMVESLDMAFMMELPMLIAVAQRLGPSTGSATTGAQGDLGMLNRLISGGYNVPVLSPSNLEDCFQLAGKSLQISAGLRTPVVLLTSKEMIETERSFNVDALPELDPAEIRYFEGDEYLPYSAGDDLVPDFLPLGDDHHQVRMTASTHDEKGLLSKANPEAMANTRRLEDKVNRRMERFSFYDYDSQQGAETLIVSYGITSYAAREAVVDLRQEGQKVSLLIVKTLLPFTDEIEEILSSYSNIVVAEENNMGQYKKIVYGEVGNSKVSSVNSIGRMIAPTEIVEEVSANVV